MSVTMLQIPSPVVSVFFFVCWLLAGSQSAGAEEQPRFTLEVLSDQQPIESEIWNVGPSIRIVENMSLPNTCDDVGGTVTLRDAGSEVFVSLYPKEKALPGRAGCLQQATPVVVSVTIPDMPFIQGCHHHVTLETPERIMTKHLFIVW
jgi:hypothetical protein